MDWRNAQRWKLVSASLLLFLGACSEPEASLDPCDDPTQADSALCVCPDPAFDFDCDGVAATSDCDDRDDSVGAQAKDLDCDGIPTAFDCDDADEDNLSSNEFDADCDGVPYDLDCDDNDETVLLDISLDADCDGLETLVDCDDNDPTNTASNEDDADCDGIATAVDCDDNDPGKTASSEFDHDCDHIPTTQDCDDEDATNTNLCTPCTGDYTVVGGDGTGALEALASCSSLDGHISLAEFTASDLTGLSNLLHITGTLQIVMLDGLADLSSLSRLKEVGGNLDIRVMPDLVNIDGLFNMKSIGGEVTFWSNSSLCQSEVNAFLSGGVSYAAEGMIGYNDDGC